MNDFKAFLSWEASTRDTIDLKKIYIDMANGDVLAGVALSELVYWHLPKKNGQSRMKVNRNGHEWIAIPRWEWWERTRMTPRQSDRVLKVLRDVGVIETKRWKWNNTPTVHIRIIHERFLELWNNLVNSPPINPFLPNGEMGVNDEAVKSKTSPNGEITDLTKSANLKTETTTETTTEKDSTAADAGGDSVKPVQPHIAIIDAYWQALPAKPPGDDYPRHVRVAKKLQNAGIAPEDVTRYVTAQYKEAFWQDKHMTLEHVRDNLLTWLKANRQQPKQVDIAPLDDAATDAAVARMFGLEGVL